MTPLLLHHHRTGNGPLLILLHGLGSSADDWELQVPAFSQRYTVITVDLRGHGRSLQAGDRVSFTIPQMADDVAALIESLTYLPQAHTHTPAPPHILGLSLGGCVALSLAHRHPELVRSLVLVNTFARLRPAGVRGLGRFIRRLWLFAFAPMPALAAFIAQGLFPRPEQRPYRDVAVERLGRNTKRHYWAAMRAIAAFDLRRRLPSIRCPALVVAGDRDQTVPRVCAEQLSQGLPNARLALVPDSGHATPYDQTEVFNRLVLEFLEGLDDGRP